MAGIEIKTHLLHMAAEGYGTSAVSCTLAVQVGGPPFGSFFFWQTRENPY